MPIKLRRFIGAITLFLSLAAIVTFAIAIAPGRLSAQPGIVQVGVSFGLALLWAFVAAIIIKWTYKDKKQT